ncbi:MAG: glycosyltransferase family 4 protein [Solirubrobacteraceae bacterium]
MNIALLDPAAFTLVYDHALAQALADQGCSVDLLTSHYPFAAMPAERGYGVRLSFTNHPQLARSKVASLGRRLGRHTREMVRIGKLADRYDLLHFQWFAIPLIDNLIRLPRRPIVFTPHDVVRRETTSLQHRAQLGLCHRADAIITHYQRGRERLIESGIAADRIRVIPIGAYEHLASQPYEEPLEEALRAWEGPVVLFFGVLRPNKGLEVLLEAWRGITNAELWIVGAPNMDVRSLVAAAPPNVRFVSRWVNESELPTFFRRADLVVLPYTDIDQSGVALTALAFGKPLLLSDVGGFPDIAGEGAAAMVAAGDPGALHDAMARLLADPEARERLANGATAGAKGPFSWARIAEQTIAVYREVLAGP